MPVLQQTDPIDNYISLNIIQIYTKSTWENSQNYVNNNDKIPRTYYTKELKKIGIYKCTPHGYSIAFFVYQS